MKRFLAIAMMFVLFMGLIGCSVDTKVNQLAADEQTDTEEMLDFIDAQGKEHQVKVREDVRKHPYNWEFLEGTEHGLLYEDTDYTSRRGIDVSKYQGEIDWTAVAGDGVAFAYIRLGYRGYGEEGKICLDERFYQNLKGARQAGLDVGVYFFSQAISEEEALEEAQFVLETLDGTALELPVVYDPERILTDEARTDAVDGAQFTKNTLTFCQAISDAGYEPMVYSNMVWEAFEFDMSAIEQYPVWYADYEAVPQTPYDFVCWQYSESGIVSGIEGYVDLNLEFVMKK